MRLSRCRAVPVYVLLFTLMLAWTLAPQAAPAAKQVLRLRTAGAFDPAVGEPAVPGEVSLQAAAREYDLDGGRTRGRGHYIVQFDGPVTELWKANLQAAGAELLGYVPDNAFAVRAPRGKSASFRRVDHVRAVTPLHPAYLLSPDLPKRASGRVEVRITTFTPGDVPALTKRVRQLNGRVENVRQEPEGMVTAKVPVDALRPLARVFGVSWIEPHYPMQLVNGVAADIANVDSARVDVGLYGTNQIVGVADSGLDTGDNNSVGLGATGTIHQDFRGRILAGQSFNNRGAWSDYVGHGTHVVGSVLGSGLRGGSDPTTQSYGGTGSYAGMAPEANLVMQSLANANGGLSALDLYPMLQSAYDVGARIHSNSYGSSTAGQYTIDSHALDTFMWDHPDMLVVFAAGNDGRDANNNGIVDADSMGSPATAKNCLTVGASESLRTGTGFPIVGASFGFAASPISGDGIANNVEGMAAFSSRGPTDDGRIKPDVVTPGTYIASTRTHLPLGDDVEGGAGNWVVSISSAGIGQWTRSGAGGARSGTTSWYCSLQNPTGAVQRTDLYQTVDTRGLGSPYLSFWLGRNLSASATLAVAVSTDGINFSDIATYNTTGTTFTRVNLGPITKSATLTVRFRFSHVATNTTNAALYAAVDNFRIYDSTGYWGLVGDTNSSLAGTTVDEEYFFLGGTSMATPLTAGACALVRQYYQEVLNHRSPSAALIKATVMAGAKDMTGQYTSTFNDLSPARPNSVEGWGRLDLAKSLPSPTASSGAKLFFIDNPKGLRTGESDTYTFNAVAGTALNVVLAYTDRPPLTLSGVNLVNNLDLDLTAPNSTTSSGNGLASDAVNNVEGVDIVSGSVQNGVYTVTITGTNAPEGPQPYALVVYGNVSRAASLSISPSAARVVKGHNYQFGALFNGQPTTAVTWSVQSGGGSITSTGLYTAPASGTSALIRATYGGLTADSTVTLIDGEADVTLRFIINHPAFTELTTCEIGAEPKPGFGGLTTGNLDITGFGSGNVGLALDLPASAVASYLPPSDLNKWWIRVGDGTSNGNSGTITGFSIEFNGTIWESVSGDVAIPQGSSARKWIDYTAPTAAITAPTAGQSISGSTTITATATDNDRVLRVEFYEDDRLLGTDSTSPYSLAWDTTRATNMPHRVSVKAYDLSSNVSEAFVVVGTNNTGTRPNVVTGMSGWSFNSSTRVMTATLTLNNTGNATAFRVALQKLTLFGTGSSFSGTRAINMQPSTGVPFPRNFSSMGAGGTQTLTLTATLPPEVTAIPRWTVTGNYYDLVSGGNQFRL